VADLAHTHGFATAFFWQPMALAGGKVRTEDERLAIRGLSTSDSSFANLVYRIAAKREAAVSGWYDLTTVFDTVASAIYIDPVHVNPPGNERIARAMVCRLLGDLAWKNALVRHAIDPARVGSNARCSPVVRPA
jgi:hypothetical protein